MKKYWMVAKNTWSETFTYRINFVMWRIRMVLNLLSMYFIWLAIIPQNVILAGYNQSLILTYILGTSILWSIVFSTRTIGLGEDINRGKLSAFLLQPINFFTYTFFKDLGDKAMNILFGVFEIIILVYFLRPPLFLQHHFGYLFSCFLAILIALIIYFFFNLLIGFFGFWTPEVWAPRFISFILINFFTGMFFPLDVLPQPIFKVFQFLPFTYLVFFPLKIYLGQLNTLQIIQGVVISLIWVLLMYKLTLFVWHKGLKNYSAQGI